MPNTKARDGVTRAMLGRVGDDVLSLAKSLVWLLVTHTHSSVRLVRSAFESVLLRTKSIKPLQKSGFLVDIGLSWKCSRGKRRTIEH